VFEALGTVEGDRDDDLRNGTRDRDALANAVAELASFDEDPAPRFGSSDASVDAGVEGSAIFDESPVNGASVAVDGALPVANPFAIVSSASAMHPVLGASSPDGGASELATVVDADPTYLRKLSPSRKDVTGGTFTVADCVAVAADATPVLMRLSKS
jgi:hypothetical protein